MSIERMISRIPIFFLLAFILFLNGCKNPVELQSKWIDKEIVIDANDIDWKDYPFLYDQKTRSCIGVYNDDKNLYLCFQTMDKDIQRQILNRGLYIWFNKTGKKDKELALCFPEGGGFGGPGGPGPGGRGGPGGSPDMSRGMPGLPTDMSGFPEGTPDDPNMRSKRPFLQGFSPAAKLRILTSEDDEGYNCSVERAAKLGIEVKYNIDDQSRFIYELKMPIAETDRTAFVARASASNQMGIGFMTAKMEMKGPRGGMGGPGGGMGGPGGGRGGPGGGMGGPGGGMGGPGGGMGGKEASLEIWTNVTLASKPVNTQ